MAHGPLPSGLLFVNVFFFYRLTLLLVNQYTINAETGGTWFNVNKGYSIVQYSML